MGLNDEPLYPSTWDEYDRARTEHEPEDVPEPNATAMAGRFIRRDGLQVVTLGEWVRSRGPLAMGADGRLWQYRHGVWRRGGAEEVARRVREALGEKFRTGHLHHVRTWLEADEPTITAEPVHEYLNVTNGLLEWRTGELHPHDPSVLSTVQLPVRWDPTARCPGVDDFLAAAAPEDALDFLEEVLGYLVMAGNPLQVAFLLLGPGATGKGTFLNLATALMGHHNVASVPLQVLAENRFAAAQLFAILANVAGDLDARLVERTDVFKMATGGDAIYGEHKFRDGFTFRPWATMLFSANEAPATRDHTDGYYRRWVVVPFTNVVPPERRQPEHVMAARLHRPSELSGLLVRAVAGLRRLMERGRFAPPGSVQDAGEAFKLATDPVRAFAVECLAIGAMTTPDSGVPCWLPRSEVYGRFKAWCFENGRGQVSAARFYEALGGLGVGRATRQGTDGLYVGKSPRW